jgi:leucyl-tRNA synthetase
MKLSNSLSSGLAQASPAVREEAMSALVRLLAPFAPHLAEEFWQRLGGQDSVHRQPWPDHDPDALVMESIEVVIQVKGKVRGSMTVAVDCSKEELERLALASDVAQRWLEGKPPRRVIVVPGKLVNLVPSS